MVKESHCVKRNRITVCCRVGRSATSRVFDVAVAACLLLSTLAGFLILTNPMPARGAVGDLIVTHVYVIEDVEQLIDGNVSICDGGELILRNSILSILNPSDPALRHRIIVENGGRLSMENSSVMSNHPTEAVLEGNATIIADRAAFHRINITANGSATLSLKSVLVMNGTLCASSGSTASFEIADAVFSHTPLLAGQSVGNFTNTTAPSIAVMEDAVANIYRYMHVTVIDGNDERLPGALVSTRFYVSGTEASWAYSSTNPDTFGVAMIRLGSTIITGSGSTFIGNYWVNASYSGHGGPYYAPEMAVGVMPYSEPLSCNATLVSMTIDGALPDLAVLALEPVTFSTSCPREGDVVTVYANISNIGVLSAFNVTVDFYDDVYDTGMIDDSEKFATVCIPVITPDSHSIAHAEWTAVPPKEPCQHRIIILVDPSDSIAELDENLAIGAGWITVMRLPDLVVFSNEFSLYSSPQEIVVDLECTLAAVVWNLGDEHAHDVLVSFCDDGDTIGSTTIPTVEMSSFGIAYLHHVFLTVGTHNVSVLVNPDHLIPEAAFANNNASREFDVLEHPNLCLSNIAISPFPSIPSGAQVSVSADLENLNEASFQNPVVRMYVNSSHFSWESEKVVLGVLTNQTGKVKVTFNFTAPIIEETIVLHIVLMANPDNTAHETIYWDNLQMADVDLLYDLPPTADAGEDQTVMAGEEMGLDGSGSTDDFGISNYTWTFEDNGIPVVLYGQNVNYTFLAEGIYTITLTVQDQWGRCSNDTTVVTVAGIIPEFPILTVAASGLLIVILAVVLSMRRRRRTPADSSYLSGKDMEAQRSP